MSQKTNIMSIEETQYQKGAFLLSNNCTPVVNDGLVAWEQELASGLHDRNSRDANEGRG